MFGNSAELFWELDSKCNSDAVSRPPIPGRPPEGWYIIIFDHKTIDTSGPLGRALLSDVKYALGKVLSK